MVIFNSTEIEFWKYYKENYFETFERDKIEGMIKKDDSVLVPYFLFYSIDLHNHNPINYSDKIVKLKSLLSETNTIKNKYVLSMIEAAENQKRMEME